MEYKGLTIIDKGENNSVVIEEGCVFQLSQILITGDNNQISIGKALSYSSLNLNLRGNDKAISIGPSNKNINNLKIVSIRGNSQTVTIGNNFSCGGMEIQMNDGDENLSIGNNCLFSWGIKARTSDGHSIIDLETNKPINFPDDINIGNSVWISEDVKILKGAHIPDNCVVGSSSIVTKKFQEQNSVIAGIPAKVVKSGIKWDYRYPAKYLEQTSK